ncbi:MAG: hypothetical protein NZL92_04885 [Gloeomargarita sp. SKYG116]|nr:hypothetical protein [Gloeomargarita sp. SKYG116]MDW8401010.1 hypothetical protein [Gloeomargarita sp. SKYGB_i_bin116]
MARWTDAMLDRLAEQVQANIEAINRLEAKVEANGEAIRELRAGQAMMMEIIQRQENRVEELRRVAIFTPIFVN